MIKFPKTIQAAVEQFNRLPGIGRKTAERLVYFLMKKSPDELGQFSRAILDLANQINTCENCYNFAETNPCHICNDTRRDRDVICVVAESHDLAALENTEEFKGVYHVLGGTINALEGITPDRLRVKELLERTGRESNAIKEIILAFNPDLEGETTSIYLKNLLKLYPLKITRLAKGLPMGGVLEYADEATLANAIKGRTLV